MKYSEILEKAHEIENTYIMVKEPTKTHYGYAVRMCNDPEIELVRIDNTEHTSDKIKIDKKYYWRLTCMFFPIEIVNNLIIVLEKLVNAEM